MAFLDSNWTPKWSTTVGYSMVDIDNSDGQTADAYNKGQYASANVLYTPVKDALVGAEFQWGHRENFSDGWTVSDYRIQVTFKYNFSYKLGG